MGLFESFGFAEAVIVCSFVPVIGVTVYAYALLRKLRKSRAEKKEFQKKISQVSKIGSR